MRHYELVCIVHPDLDETAFNGVVEKVKGWAVETGGSVDKVEIWGRKRLGVHHQETSRRSVRAFQSQSRTDCNRYHGPKFTLPGTGHSIYDHCG